jgi:hypothetical protein
MAPYGSGSLNGKPFVIRDKSDPKRGGRFLARAVKDGTRGIEQEVAGEVRRILGGGRGFVNQPGAFRRAQDYGDEE